VSKQSAQDLCLTLIRVVSRSSLFGQLEHRGYECWMLISRLLGPQVKVNICDAWYSASLRGDFISKCSGMAHIVKGSHSIISHSCVYPLLGCAECMSCRQLRLMVSCHSVSVSQSVCHVPVPCKNGWTDRRPVWVRDFWGQRNIVLDGGPSPFRGGQRGNVSFCAVRKSMRGSDVAVAKLLWPLVRWWQGWL